MSQNTAILSALLAGYALTDHDARVRFGCTRLAARVNDLRREGYRIDSRIVRRGSVHYAEYSMSRQGVIEAAPRAARAYEAAR